MTKVVYSACYGGYGLSHECVMRYAELKGITLYVDDTFSLCNTYTTIPKEEYQALQKTAQASKATDRYKELNSHYFSPGNIERDDPLLIQAIEEIGVEKAGSKYAKLVIVDIPAGTMYKIDEYDGFESIEYKESDDWRIA